MTIQQIVAACFNALPDDQKALVHTAGRDAVSQALDEVFAGLGYTDAMAAIQPYVSGSVSNWPAAVTALTHTPNATLVTLAKAFRTAVLASDLQAIPLAFAVACASLPHLGLTD